MDTKSTIITFETTAVKPVERKPSGCTKRAAVYAVRLVYNCIHIYYVLDRHGKVKSKSKTLKRLSLELHRSSVIEFGSYEFKTGRAQTINPEGHLTGQSTKSNERSTPLALLYRDDISACQGAGCHELG